MTREKDVDGDSASLEKQLSAQKRQIENLKKENQIIAGGLGKSFSMFRIDLEQKTFQYLSETRDYTRFINEADTLEQKLHRIVGFFVAPEYQEGVLEFLDTNTIAKRMLVTDSLSYNYEDIYLEACRFVIHAANRNEEGWVTCIIVSAVVMDAVHFRHSLVDKLEQGLNTKLGQKDLGKNDYDSLTGLLNTRGFERVLATVDAKEKVALLIIDVDDMVKFNDTYGVFIANEVLAGMGEKLRDSFRHTDYCMRLKHDCFMVIMRHLREFNRDLISGKINELNGLLGMSRYPISISAGIAYSSKGFTEKLLPQAEAALEYVKEHGKKGYRFYNELSMETNADKEHRRWLNERERRLLQSHQDASEAQEAMLKESSRSWYREEMFYQYNDYGELLNRKQYYIDLVLSGNNAVGVVTGFKDDNLSLYCISGFGLKGLGYTDFNEFGLKTKGSFLNVVHREDRAFFLKKLEDPVISRFKVRLRNSQGVALWYEFTTLPIKGLDGSNMWVASMRSINDLMVSSICEQDYIAVGMIRLSNGMIVLNKNTIRKNGRQLDSARVLDYNKMLMDEVAHFVRPNDREAVLTNLRLSHVQEQLELDGIYEYIAYHRNPEGKYSAIRHKFRYFDKERGLLLVTDEAVTNWAETDHLTGFLNEGGFFRRSENILRDADDKADYAVLFFNICGFKAINAVLGEQGGNVVLKNLASELSASELNPLLTARFRADQFFLLVKRGHVDVRTIAKLCDLEVMAENSFVHVHMRCGICFMDKMEQESRLTCDKAVLAARRVQGESPVAYCFYDSNMKSDYLNRIDILARLNDALKNHEFHVYYQPIYDAQTKKLASAEALVRWYHPEKGIVSPGVFIPTLEKNGRIAALDLFVHRQAVEFLSKRREDGLPIVPVSMNLSRTDFMNTQMIEELLESVEQSPLPDEYMKFEVTESAVMDVGQQGAEVLDKLRGFGCQVLLDDFGVGASSLSSLTDGKFDVIKLDMSFVRSIGKNSRTEEVLKASIDLAHKMGNRVVGEGVETDEQFEFLRAAGCDYIQGYYFSKPLAQEEFAEWLDSGR